MSGINYRDKDLLNNSIIAKIFPNSTFEITAKNLQQTLQDIVETLWREEKRNYLAYSDITQKVINNGTDGTTDEFYLDFGKFKQGDGFRIKIYGSFSSVTEPSGITVEVNTVYKDVTGLNKQVAGIDTFNFAESEVSARWIAEFEVFFDVDTQTFSYCGDVRTQDFSNKLITNDRSGTPPLATFGSVGIEIITTVNGSDQLIIEGVAVEHIIS